MGATHGYHCPGDMAVRMRESLAWPWVQKRGLAKGAFHLSELTGQTNPVTKRISLLIKTIQLDQ